MHLSAGCFLFALAAGGAIEGRDAQTDAAQSAEVETLDQLWQRGKELRRARRWSEAIATLRETETRQAAELGLDSFEVARTRIHLAESLAESGRGAEALAPARSGMSRIEELGRDLDEEGLRLRSKHAYVLLVAGQLEEGEEHLRVLVIDLERELPDDVCLRAYVCNNQASALRHLGRIPEARDAFADLVHDLEPRVEPDDFLLASARQNLASSLATLGELYAARAVLEEAWQAVSARPPDNGLLELRMTLAGVLGMTGDHLLARRHLTEMLADWDDAFSPLLRAGILSNLALAEQKMGERDVALEHAEASVTLYEQHVPDDHYHLRLARGIRTDLLDQAARDEPATRAQLLADLEERFPADHVEVRAARQLLARATSEAGDAEATRRILLRQIEVLERLADPRAMHELATARWSLATALAQLGRREEALPIAHLAAGELLANTRRDLQTLSPRVLRNRLDEDANPTALLLSQALGEADDEVDVELLEAVFTLTQIRQGGALARARLRSLLPPPERAALRGAREELARAAASGASRADVRAAIDREEAAWQPLAGHAAVAKLAASLPSAEEVARTLAEGEAAVVFQAVLLRQLASGTEQDVLLALLVRGDGALDCLDLGPIEEIRRAVWAWRSSLGVAEGADLRGLAVGEGPGAGSEEARETGTALRRLTLDPILARLGPDVGRLVVSNDGVLHLVPWDALPVGDGERRLGDDLRIDVRAALWNRVLEATPRPTRADVLVAVGGVDYDLGGDEARSTAFEPLPGAAREVRELGRRAKSEAGVEVLLFEGEDARPGAVVTASGRARWLHLATHGYGPGDEGRVVVDAEAIAHGVLDEHELVWMTPMLLSGLALSGANDVDAGGRSRGVVTAAELATWDLEGCDLVVLSACDTARGVRRGGQGVESLQRAVLEAGAGAVVASLWKVPDESTRELMVAFYVELFTGRGKAEALWAAKCDLRARRDAGGRPLHSERDWAGWVLVGDTD